MKEETLLTNIEEPSDTQLSALMREVAQEAKRKAVLAQQQLSETIAQEILKAQLLFKAKQL